MSRPLLSNNGFEFRILLVEDREEDAELTEAFLTRFVRCQISRVFTKPAFKSALDELKPDLILSDAGLPTFEGLDALRIARHKCPAVPVVFFSGNNNPDKKLEALELGAADYVSKDDAPALLRVIERLLNTTKPAAGCESDRANHPHKL